MVKESVRKCSHCGHNGHNSRTCNGKAGGCIKLFGVNIASTEKQEISIKKSFSMGNLQSLAENKASAEEDGYLSDGQIHSKRNRATHERKKGKPWSKEEHKIFLAGLQALGRGDWKGISKNFVTSRSPTQVASHAQKYFLRQASNDKKKRRSSLFDMPLKESSPTPQDFHIPTQKETAKIFPHQASSSSALQPGNAPGITTQGTTSSQIVNRFPHLCLDERPVMTPMAASVLPTYPGFQYMAAPKTGRIMNYAISGYLEMPRTLAAIVTCAPVIHPSGIPSSPNSVALAHSMLRAVPGTSLPQKDPLELKIAPPKASQKAQASGAISVI